MALIDDLLKMVDDMQKRLTILESRNQVPNLIQETQMQINPEQRFTDSATYVEYNDAQIKLDFGDWVNHKMYFEAVMKTGAGTGFVRLYNIDDATEFTEVQTTSTSVVSVRSAEIPKPTSGVKNIRESQKIAGGGGAFTDIYIGRLVIRP